MDMFLSGHGSSDTTQNYRLRCELVTFCPIGDVLDLSTSWRVFDALVANDVNAITALTHARYPSGTMVPMMTLYPTTDFTSGIFEVGSRIASRGLDGGQFTLRDFCALYRGVGTVYWIACLS